MGQAFLAGAACLLFLGFVLWGAWRLDRYEDSRERDFKETEGFIYWPPCPKCNNIAVSCVGRYPVNSSPSKTYTLACDHGLDASGLRPRAEWPGSGFCGQKFTRTHAEIVSMQMQLKDDREL